MDQILLPAAKIRSNWIWKLNWFQFKIKLKWIRAAIYPSLNFVSSAPRDAIFFKMNVPNMYTFYRKMHFSVTLVCQCRMFSVKHEHVWKVPFLKKCLKAGAWLCPNKTACKVCVAVHAFLSFASFFLLFFLYSCSLSTGIKELPNTSQRQSHDVLYDSIANSSAPQTNKIIATR